MSNEVVEGMLLVTRTDRHVHQLEAFLKHHLQVCDGAMIIADVRPSDNIDEIRDLCENYGSRVALFEKRGDFRDGESERHLARMAGIYGRNRSRLIFHLDKDEFIDDLDYVRNGAAEILAGKALSCAGTWVNRFAVGINTYPNYLPSYEDYKIAAPIRSLVRGLPTISANKHFLTPYPHVRMHVGWGFANVVKPMTTVEHFCWTDDVIEKQRAKDAKRDAPDASGMTLRMRNRAKILTRDPEWMDRIIKGIIM